MAESAQAASTHQGGQWGGGGEYDAAYSAVYATGGEGYGNGAGVAGQPVGGWAAQQAGLDGEHAGYYDEHGGYYDAYGGYYDAYGQYFPAAGAADWAAAGGGGWQSAGGEDAATEGDAAQAAAREVHNAVGEGSGGGAATENAVLGGLQSSAAFETSTPIEGVPQEASATGGGGSGGSRVTAPPDEERVDKDEKEDEDADEEEDEEREEDEEGESSSESSDTESGEGKKEGAAQEGDESEEEPVWVPKDSGKAATGPRSMTDRIAEKHREEEERGLMAAEDEESDAMRQDELRAKQYLDYLRSMVRDHAPAAGPIPPPAPSPHDPTSSRQFEADMAERAARERQRKLERAMLMEDGFAFRSERLVSLRRWKNTPGALIREMRGHEGAVLALGRALRGEDVVSASADCTLRLWRLRTGQCVRVFRGHSRPVQSCAVSTDGRFLASASADLTAIVWDLHLGIALRTLQGTCAARSCAKGRGGGDGDGGVGAALLTRLPSGPSVRRALRSGSLRRLLARHVAGGDGGGGPGGAPVGHALWAVAGTGIGAHRRHFRSRVRPSATLPARSTACRARPRTDASAGGAGADARTRLCRVHCAKTWRTTAASRRPAASRRTASREAAD